MEEIAAKKTSSEASARIIADDGPPFDCFSRFIVVKPASDIDQTVYRKIAKVSPLSGGTKLNNGSFRKIPVVKTLDRRWCSSDFFFLFRVRKLQ